MKEKNLVVGDHSLLVCFDPACREYWLNANRRLVLLDDSYILMYIYFANVYRNGVLVAQVSDELLFDHSHDEAVKQLITLGFTEEEASAMYNDMLDVFKKTPRSYFIKY